MLEEVVIEVALEPLAERRAAGLPPNAVSKLQRAAHHQRLGTLAGEVHLDDLNHERGGLRAARMCAWKKGRRGGGRKGIVGTEVRGGWVTMCLFTRKSDTSLGCDIRN